MKRSSVRHVPSSLLALATCVALTAFAASTAAQPVGSEFRVNTWTTSNQYAAAVASDAGGNFVVVWQSTQGGDSDLFGQRYDSAGSPIGSEFKVNTYTKGSQRNPAVASDPGGAFVVVWESSQPQDRDGGIFGQRYDPLGNPIGSEFRANTYRRGGQGSPGVALLGSGDFVVVWHGSRSDSISGQRFDGGGNRLGDEFRVNANMFAPQVDPSVAADASGNFMVVWTCVWPGRCAEDPYVHRNILGQRFDATGRRLGEELTIYGVPPYHAQFTGNPDVAADAAGTFVVVWSSSDGMYYSSIYGARYDSQGQKTGGWVVDEKQRYDWCCLQNPSVSTDEKGDFIVVWEHPFAETGGEPKSIGVFGRRYEASGQAGPRFQVNTYTTGVQAPSSGGAVSSDPLGNFIVVWTSQGQDGSGYGVFGQRYGPLAARDRDHEPQ